MEFHLSVGVGSLPLPQGNPERNRGGRRCSGVFFRHKLEEGGRELAVDRGVCWGVEENDMNIFQIESTFYQYAQIGRPHSYREDMRVGAFVNFRY